VKIRLSKFRATGERSNVNWSGTDGKVDADPDAADNSGFFLVTFRSLLCSRQRCSPLFHCDILLLQLVIKVSAYDAASRNLTKGGLAVDWVNPL
jgi:hypothetical protein